MIKLNLSGHANKHLDEMGFITPGSLHVDLADPNLPEKLIKFLGELIPPDGDQVQVVLPGLSPLAALVIAAIHGMTGSFPVVVPMIRQADGSFLPGEGWDLQQIRDAARQSRQGTIVL